MLDVYCKGSFYLAIAISLSVANVHAQTLQTGIAGVGGSIEDGVIPDDDFTEWSVEELAITSIPTGHREKQVTVQPW